MVEKELRRAPILHEDEEIDSMIGGHSTFAEETRTSYKVDARANFWILDYVGGESGNLQKQSRMRKW